MIISLQIQSKIKDIAKKKLDEGMSQHEEVTPQDKMVKTIQNYMTHNPDKFQAKDLESQSGALSQSSAVETNESS